jgi:hypothetical protein
MPTPRAPGLFEQPLVQYLGDGLHGDGLEERQRLGREIITGVLRRLLWVVKQLRPVYDFGVFCITSL